MRRRVLRGVAAVLLGLAFLAGSVAQGITGHTGTPSASLAGDPGGSGGGGGGG